MTVPISPTMPAPDIQQPIVRYDEKRKQWLCDPVWYRFFRSPQFSAATIGGAVGQGTGAPKPAPISPVATVSQLSSQSLMPFISDGEDGADGFPIQGQQGLQGPGGVSIPGADGETGEEGIPGPIGSTGLQGIAGLVIPGLDGMDGEDGFGVQMLTAVGIGPLIKNSTRVVTAISGVKPSNSQSTSSTLTADTDLTLTFNETGTYALDGYLSFYETTLGTGGFQFDFNSGSATVGVINFGVDGYVTAAVGNAGVTSVSTATSFGTIVTSSSAPSWLRITGYLTVTNIGTFALRWAQAATLTLDPTNLLAGSRIMATKIG